MFLLAVMLACSSPPAAPVSPESPTPVGPVTRPAGTDAPAPAGSPTEPTPTPIEPTPAAPAGMIGGEPILPKAIVLGAISTQEVVAGITPHQAAIDACYTTRAAANPELAGKVLVKFIIGRDGHVKQSSTASTSLRDEATETCVNERVREATFPALKDGDVAIVRYPFDFTRPR